MFCKQCGQQNTDDARFCSSCGNKLEGSNIQSSLQTQKELTPPRKGQVKLWNPNAAANWSLLFTPVFGSYLQMKNWKALGELQKVENAKKWLLVSIIVILLLNFGAYLIEADPEQFATRAKSLGLLYIIIWYFSFAKNQSKYVKETLNDHYHKKSWVLPLIISTVILFIYVFIVMLVNSSIQKTSSQQKPWEMDWGNNQSTEAEYRRNESQDTAQQQINTTNSYDISPQNINIPTKHNPPSIYVANPEVDPNQYISRTNNNPQYAIDYSEQDKYYRASQENNNREISYYNNQNNNVAYSTNASNSYETSTNSYSVPAPQRVPSTITSCDDAGCWGSDGTRYNRGAGDTYFPSTGGVCQGAGGQMQCN